MTHHISSLSTNSQLIAIYRLFHSEALGVSTSAARLAVALSLALAEEGALWWLLASLEDRPPVGRAATARGDAMGVARSSPRRLWQKERRLLASQWLPKIACGCCRVFQTPPAEARRL